MSSRSVVLSVAARVLYPLMLVIAVWVLLRGHNQPGGGFIGGMIAVAATSLWAVAFGAEQALDRIPLGPLRLGAIGALLALASGLAAVVLGKPFLTHLWLYPVSTVIPFDAGIFATVWAGLGAICAHAIGLDEEVQA